MVAKITHCPARNGAWRCTLPARHEPTDPWHVDGRGKRWQNDPVERDVSALQSVQGARTAVQLAVTALAPVCDETRLGQQLGLVLRDLRAHAAQLETAECWLQASDHTEQGETG